MVATQTHPSTPKEDTNSDSTRISSSPPRPSPPGQSTTNHAHASPGRPFGLSKQSRLSEQQAKKTSLNAQSTTSQPNLVLSERSLTEVIQQTFPPFDHQGLVVGPFTEEAGRDATFEQELGTMLLDVILETHAWAAARPKHESQLAVQRLEHKISDVIEVEKAQGMLSKASPRSPAAFASSLWPAFLLEQTRERLNQFVSRMKSALAALTGS